MRSNSFILIDKIHNFAEYERIMHPKLQTDKTNNNMSAEKIEHILSKAVHRSDKEIVLDKETAEWYIAAEAEYRGGFQNPLPITLDHLGTWQGVPLRCNYQEVEDTLLKERDEEYTRSRDDGIYPISHQIKYIEEHLVFVPKGSIMYAVFASLKKLKAIEEIMGNQ
jgi:hypothetical protein